MDSSALHHFIDPHSNVFISLFSAEKLMAEAVTKTKIRPENIDFLRSLVLGMQHLITLVKNLAAIGIYVDPDSNDYSFKFESNALGHTRCLFLSTSERPIGSATFTGKIRVVHTLNKTTKPYTSIIDLKKIPFSLVADEILHRSFQIEAKCVVSDAIDQSLMIMKIPKPSSSRHSGKQMAKTSATTVKEYLFKHNKSLQTWLNASHTKESSIHLLKTELGADYLVSKDVSYRCNCSKEQMVENIKRIINLDDQPLFTEDAKPLQLTCEYCQQNYEIEKTDVFDS